MNEEPAAADMLQATWGRHEKTMCLSLYGLIVLLMPFTGLLVFALKGVRRANHIGIPNPTYAGELIAAVVSIAISLVGIAVLTRCLRHWHVYQVRGKTHDLTEPQFALTTLRAIQSGNTKYQLLPGSNKRPTAKFASAEFHHRKGRMAFCLPGELVVIQGDVACQAGLKPGLAEWLANLAGVPA
jgi:hypothetical protein